MRTYDLSTLEGQQAHYKAVRERLQTPQRQRANEQCFEGGERTNKLRDIISSVAKKHGISEKALLSGRRHRLIMHARWEAIYQAAIERPELTQSEIGRIFKRDHSSIGYAVRSYAKRTGLPIPAGWQP